MIVETLLVRLGGESGIDNAISAGDVLTRSAARSGYHVHTFRTYPAEIKGGPVMFQLRVGVRPLPSLGDQVDVLLAFNEEAWDLHHEALRPNGLLVYDPGEHDAPEGFQGRAYGIPLDRMALAVECLIDEVRRIVDAGSDVARYVRRQAYGGANRVVRVRTCCCGSGEACRPCRWPGRSK